MSYFKDPDFQLTLVKFLCKDRNFLKNVAPILKVKDFEPRRGEGMELYWIAEIALNFWNKYQEPVGGLLKMEVLDLIQRKKMAEQAKARVLKTVEQIKKSGSLVAVEALEQRIVEYKAKRARNAAVQEILALEDEGKLTNERLLNICNRILKNFGTGYTVSDYFEEIDKRITRRRMEKLRKWPPIFIDPVDERIRVLSRGDLGLILAQYKVGKSVFLTWLAYAYSLQGYKVMYVTLEDSKDQVSDRLDGLLTRVAIKQLADKPVMVKKRFRRMLEVLKAKIKIVDGTEGGMSVAMIESIWDQERNKGFMADVVIVDYDDEIEPPKDRGSEKGARRYEFADIYRELRRFAARRKIYLWTAAQAVRGKEDQKIIAGKDAAEDISKIRKVAICIGVGRDTEFGSNGRYLYIAAHRHDDSRIGFSIVGDFKRGVFYDKDATEAKRQEVEAERKKAKGRK